MKKSPKVLVIGDVMLDRYVEGYTNRMSPEAPVPIINVTQESIKLGGAANVALNLRQLSVQTLLVGCVGEDIFGKQMQQLLTTNDIVSHLYKDHTKTTVKTRVISKSQQLLRIDREDLYTPTSKIINGVESLIHIEQPDLVLISDYGKGVINPDIMNTVNHTCKQYGIRVLVDPKSKNWGNSHLSLQPLFSQRRQYLRR